MLIDPSFKGSSLCVVGNINRDVKTTPFKPGEHLLRDGESSVDSIRETIGGGGANSAFAAAVLGARDLGVSIDLNWDPSWGVATHAEIKKRKKAVRSVLPLVHVAHGNVRELLELTDTSNLDTALNSLADWGVEAVVVHLGEKGAGYYRDGS